MTELDTDDQEAIKLLSSDLTEQAVLASIL